MAKIDLDALSIEELAELRERANAKLLEKVASRQAELEAELERLSQYGRPAKKAALAPTAPKPRKDNVKDNAESDDKADADKNEVAKTDVAKTGVAKTGVAEAA